MIDQICAVLPFEIVESIETHGLLAHGTDATNFLAATFSAYVASATSPPLPYAETRTSACELCERDWIPLTYHHLIPRSSHIKALKRGWAEEWELNKVAWLCRACHNCVHRIESNDSLAEDWNSLEKLSGREDVQSFVKWVSNVRWKKR